MVRYKYGLWVYNFHNFREARIQLLQIHAKDNNLSLQENDWNLLADKTDGHSGSDLANLTLGALFEPIRDLQAATHWRSLPSKE